MPEGPLVSVVLAVHNDPDFLAEAIGSVLAQTLADWELILIDDGSTDRTPALIAEFKDPRIRVTRNPQNEGLTRSLRRGFRMARGRYLARLDADDVCLPGRLARQVAFLEAHPGIGMVGSACIHIDERGRALRIARAPWQDVEIRWVSLLTNPFVHSTVMVRRAALEERALNYDEAFQVTQDYDLWTRLLETTHGANLREPLLWYRLRSGITRKRRDQQLWNAERIAARTIGRELPGFAIEPWQIGSLRHFFHERPTAAVREDGDWRTAARIYRELFDAFAGRRGGDAGFGGVRRRFAVDTLRTAVQLRFPRGWAAACDAALVRCPTAPLGLGAHWAAALGHRLTWWLRRWRHRPRRFPPPRD